ncbi:MAG: response regulator [Candidatus Doudnabacteria bacterium]
MADTNKTILIAEDEHPLRTAVSTKLNKEGYTVLEAQDGEEALALALDKHPDLILLDIMMPKLTGIDVIHKLREDDWGKTAQIMLLTNLNDQEKVADSMINGVYAYLVKSDWRLEDIVEKIKQKIEELN